MSITKRPLWTQIPELKDWIKRKNGEYESLNSKSDIEEKAYEMLESAKEYHYAQSGDLDIIKEQRWQEAYKRAVDSLGADNVIVLMNVDWATRENAELIYKTGATVRHHPFDARVMAADGERMIALTRVSLDPYYVKIVGEPQDETKMVYEGLYTELKPLVKKFNSDFRTWIRDSRPVSDVLEDYKRLLERQQYL